jgi:hypothetical protein
LAECEKSFAELRGWMEKVMIEGGKQPMHQL